MDPNKVITIAVMGATGTGKSTFINLVSGSNLETSDNLRSCTSEVGLSDLFTLDALWVRLVDTPGFNDTELSDTEILKRIAAYLAESYHGGFKLSGLIYMYNINETRMGGTSRRNYRMFRKLCGDDTMKNVVILTNMWPEAHSELCEKRATQLETDPAFFQPIIKEGAQLLRHDGSMESAHAVLRHFLRSSPIALRIQQELVDERKDITSTDACAVLDEALAEMKRSYEVKIREIQQEWREALEERDRESQKELEQAEKLLRERFEDEERKRQVLVDEMNQERARIQQQIEELKAQILRGPASPLTEEITPPRSPIHPGLSHFDEVELSRLFADAKIGEQVRLRARKSRGGGYP